MTTQIVAVHSQHIEGAELDLCLPECRALKSETMRIIGMQTCSLAPVSPNWGHFFGYAKLPISALGSPWCGRR
jgi:hypothetical protein